MTSVPFSIHYLILRAEFCGSNNGGRFDFDREYMEDVTLWRVDTVWILCSSGKKKFANEWIIVFAMRT